VYFFYPETTAFSVEEIDQVFIDAHNVFSVVALAETRRREKKAIYWKLDVSSCSITKRERRNISNRLWPIVGGLRYITPRPCRRTSGGIGGGWGKLMLSCIEYVQRKSLPTR
jgi:hypothetical protein